MFTASALLIVVWTGMFERRWSFTYLTLLAVVIYTFLTYIYIYIYIYEHFHCMYVCVCVCVCVYIYIYIYIHIYIVVTSFSAVSWKIILSFPRSNFHQHRIYKMLLLSTILQNMVLLCYCNLVLLWQINTKRYIICFSPYDFLLISKIIQFIWNALEGGGGWGEFPSFFFTFQIYHQHSHLWANFI